MARLMPDEQIVEQARQVLRVARERGVDPILALHDAGLLWFPARELELRAEVLADAADKIEATTVDQLTGRTYGAPTALDTKGILVIWLRQAATTIRAAR